MIKEIIIGLVFMIMGVLELYSQKRYNIFTHNLTCNIIVVLTLFVGISWIIFAFY